MKPYVYAVCFSILALIGLDSCSKSNDPVAVSPVVGRWELNRGLLSGFPASYSTVNGQSLDLYYFQSFGSTIDIYSDNTFNENYRQVGVTDAAGTWAFTNNQLSLTYDIGGTDTYAYTKNKNIEELMITAPSPYTLTLPNSSTSTVDVPGRVQFVYRK